MNLSIWKWQIIIGISIFISIFILDSLWHPFPFEYHFGWWFLWFQLGLYFIWDQRHFGVIVAIWFYILFITIRGLPWTQNWSIVWRPFFQSWLGITRVSHWEKWSQKSMYSLEQLYETSMGIETQKRIEPDEPEPESEPVIESEIEDDQKSTVSNISFDVNWEQIQALEQQLKETKKET